MAAVVDEAKMPGEEGGRVFGETKDFRIALLGNVDSGKSTLCGVLSRGIATLLILCCFMQNVREY